MKVKFYVRENYKSQKIYVRVWISKKLDQSTSTGFKVKKGDFSNTYQKVKNKSTIQNRIAINKKLAQLSEYLTDCYNYTISNDNHFGKDWLKDNVNKFFNRVEDSEQYKKYLIDFVKYHIATETLNKQTGQPITDGTKRKNKSILNTLIAFEKHKNEQIQLKGIGYNFYKEFVNFCINVQGYTQNTTGTKIQGLKTWLKDANKRGFCNIDLSDFKTMTNETKDVYLTDDEINKIFSYNFNGDLRLLNARNLLVIGARTGLRVSDIMRLDKSNINGNMITIKTQKTGATIVIPLHPQIKIILVQNSGKFPRSISDQRFNDYIKEICLKVGITQIVEGGKQNPQTKRKEFGKFPKCELITSHTCRRSFASNLYGKISNSTIMGITGHRTEKEFLKYIKITPKQHAENLQEYYKQQEKENKGTEKVPMRIAK
ncbi:tyrosine-type recombinase/integrase [Tenacibaculum maritimum]|uniref:Integrase family protein n=1 Tax=Tenacibaculum maritimum NCIMB 2154 TaxID=1349785 RepID=A0A2H1E7T2_9FLAO|nr:tyrosine-type recombinase/integrase [Tenacibaculum maritimum]MCD9581987.1 site-specific integrase [Tenacibaculum maritimum]MCD9584994.1 site-specific integrase [Tenacibaculum maritimum]MCD9620443.1 site-specific integrase [Tenacibaculum maritimum]MCD9626634.1 site-specific integrase [Tenacibaculum maritimum]MCD9629032.1 site-specific integrase [Tenacibaculum maritimum]